MARHAGGQPSVGIDDGGDAGVGVAQQPAAILDRAHARHIERLPGRAGIAVPAVIRDVDQHLGAALHEQPYLIAKYFFVADEDTEAVTVGRKDDPPPSMGHVAGLLGQVLGEGKEVFIGYVLSPRHQVDLVVAAGDCAVLTHK